MITKVSILFFISKSNLVNIANKNVFTLKQTIKLQLKRFQITFERKIFKGNLGSDVEDALLF